MEGSHMSRSSVLAAALAFLAGVLLAAPVRGQSNEPVRLLRATRPFSIFSAENTWGQRFVTVLNTTEEPRSLRVVCLAEGQVGGNRLYTRLVTVPPGCSRSVTLAVRTGGIRAEPPEPPKPGQQQSRAMPKFHENFRLVDTASGRQLDKNFSLLQLLDDKTVGVAMLSNDSDEHDTTSYLANLPAGNLGPIRLMQSPSGTLPDRWYGYDITKMVFLGAMKPGSLRPSQRQALLDWVRRGGTLVVTGSDRMPEMLSGPLGRAAGVAAAGVHHPVRLRVTAADGEAIPQVALDWPMPMAELLVEDAETLHAANGLPLLTHRRLGGGHVFALAVPLGALQDPSLHGVLSEIRDRSRMRPPVDAAAFAPAGAAALQKIAARRGPPRIVPAAMLIAMAGFVLVFGLVMRPRRRGEWVWLLLAPAAVALALGTYLYGVSRAEPQRLSYIGLQTGTADGEASVRCAFSYYSGTEGRTVDIAAGGPRAVVDSIDGGAAMENVTLRTEDTVVLPERNVRMNSTYGFLVDGLVSSGGVAGTLSFGPGGLEGTLRNDTGEDIQSAVLYVNRGSYRVGDLPAGQDVAVTIGTAQRLGAREFTASTIRSATDTLRNELMRAITPAGANVSRDPVLIGYTQAAPLAPLSVEGLPRQGWLATVWPVRLTAPPPGRPLQAPAALMDLTYEYIGAPIWNPFKEEFVDSFRPVELIVLAAPPRQVGAIAEARARLTVSIRAESYQLTVNGVTRMEQRSRGGAGRTADGAERRPSAAVSKWDLDRVEISAFDSPTGVKTIDIPDANRFRRSDGTYVFSLAVRSLTDKPRDITDASSWKFESIDVSLEGISGDSK